MELIGFRFFFLFRFYKCCDLTHCHGLYLGTAVRLRLLVAWIVRLKKKTQPLTDKNSRSGWDRWNGVPSKAGQLAKCLQWGNCYLGQDFVGSINIHRNKKKKWWKKRNQTTHSRLQTSFKNLSWLRELGNRIAFLILPHNSNGLTITNPLLDTHANTVNGSDTSPIWARWHELLS